MFSIMMMVNIPILIVLISVIDPKSMDTFKNTHLIVCIRDLDKFILANKEYPPIFTLP